MSSRDEELWDQVSRLVESRPGWSYEPSTTPGGPPSWCFLSGGEVEFSVSVSGGAPMVYVPMDDREIPLPDLDALTAWIDRNEGRFA
ncbi:MAG: hypothetical protein ACLPVF_07845 [Acidimicrobiales bacterium]